MIIYKIFFLLMLRVFKENMNYQLPLSFYSSYICILKDYSFQNKLGSTGLETCQRLVITIYYDFQKHSGLVVLLERSQFAPQKFICSRERDKTFKSGKRYEDKKRRLSKLFCILCNYPCTVSFWVKILLLQLKKLYHQFT